VIAALVAVAGTAAVGVTGAAGASGQADHRVYALEVAGGTFCFSTDSTTCAGHVDLDISGTGSGDTVIWDFSDGPYANPHNAVSDSGNWSFSTGAPTQNHVPNPDRFTFTQNGTYEFICEAHPVQMSGTITVTGGSDPTSSPSPSPTVSATPTPTPSTQPSDPGITTPRPTGGASDLVKPTLKSIGAKGKRRAVRVTFRLSENATVTIRVKRGNRTVRTITKQLAAGKRSLAVRSAKLRKGRRYRVVVWARDASGNVSTPASKSLRIRR
jgi:plastocyanin